MRFIWHAIVFESEKQQWRVTFKSCGRRDELTRAQALVAGSSVFMNPDSMIPLTTMGFLSPCGLCYSFDERANGYARGEGFGVVILKLLRDALRDCDTIRAVIRASGSNHDGRSLGLTQPSNVSQKAIIRQTYAAGGLDLDQTRYFEAHGTGTGVGDPIEANSIGSVFAAYRSPEEPLYVGAVKSNIGHLEGCSGVAGLIKTVLVLEHGVIPPNINFEKVNPKIDPAALNIKFPLENYRWPGSGLRRASINSFGYGGSNAHVILDDAYNYLKSRGLKGKHWTAKLPPNQDVIDKYNSLIMRPKKHADESNNEGSDKGNVNEVDVKAEDAVLDLIQDTHITEIEESANGNVGDLIEGSTEEPAATVEFTCNGEVTHSVKEISGSRPPSSSPTSSTRTSISKDGIGFSASSPDAAENASAKAIPEGTINETIDGTPKDSPGEGIETNDSVKEADKVRGSASPEAVNEADNKPEALEQATAAAGNVAVPVEIKQSFVSQQDALPKLFVWSSDDGGGPSRFASAFTDYLVKVLHRIKGAEEEQVFLQNLAFTLSSKRSLLSYRTYSTANSLAVLIDNIKEGLPKATRSPKGPKLGFIFTGQGAQWHAMGRELLHNPQFKSSLQEADKHFQSIGSSWSIFGELVDIVSRIVG
jgi:hypothetical protein